MKQKIEIDVPDGKKVVYDESTQTLRFIDIPKSKSWDEFCENHPKKEEEEYYYIAPDGEITASISNQRYPNDLSSREDAEGILALGQLTLLHDEWVGDWKPTYFSEEFYYSICFNGDNLVVSPWRSVHFLLSFPTEEMADEFKGYFEDLILKAKKFL